MPLMSVYQPREKPKPLTGKIRTRAEARLVYQNIVDELNSCEDMDTLEIYLMTVGEELLQFENELEFFWNGDNQDFLGLDKEIKAAFSKMSISY